MAKTFRRHSSVLAIQSQPTSDNLDTLESGDVELSSYKKATRSISVPQRNPGFVSEDFKSNFSDDSSNVTGDLPSSKEESAGVSQDEKSLHSYEESDSKCSKIVKFIDDHCCLCFLPLQIYNYLSERSPKVMLIFNTLQIVIANTILSIIDVTTDVKKAYDYLSYSTNSTNSTSQL